MGKQVRDMQGRYSSFKFFMRKVWFWSKIGVVASLFAIVIFSLGLSQNFNTVYAQNIIVSTTTIEFPAILQKIAKAESGNTQFVNGQMVIHVNTNGTYDQCKYQINSIWNKLAGQMHYNLANEKDCEAFALYLFNTYGSEPWSASKTRWSK